MGTSAQEMSLNGVNSFFEDIIEPLKDLSKYLKDLGLDFIDYKQYIDEKISIKKVEEKEEKGRIRAKLY